MNSINNKKLVLIFMGNNNIITNAFGFCNGFKFHPLSPINDLILKILNLDDVNANTIVFESPTSSNSSISSILFLQY